VQQHDSFAALRRKTIDEKSGAREEDVGESGLPIEVVVDVARRKQKLMLADVDGLPGCKRSATTWPGASRENAILPGPRAVDIKICRPANTRFAAFCRPMKPSVTFGCFHNRVWCSKYTVCWLPSSTSTTGTSSPSTLSVISPRRIGSLGLSLSGTGSE